VTEDELDRETERLFSAARRDRPAGALRELVMRGVSRGERARVRARRVTTFAWAAVAAGVGGLVWLTATADRPAANVGAEPSAHGLPSAPVPVPVPDRASPPTPSASVTPRKPVTARPIASTPVVVETPPVDSPSAAPEPPKLPDLSKAMEERK
jgi:hypothetical protein